MTRGVRKPTWRTDVTMSKQAATAMILSLAIGAASFPRAASGQRHGYDRDEQNNPSRLRDRRRGQ